MLIPKGHLLAIYQSLFEEGVCVATKVTQGPHKYITLGSGSAVRNLHVMKAMQSLVSRGLVKQSFCWRHYYWTLTDAGIQYIREFLHLPPELVPCTLRRAVRAPQTRQGLGRGRIPARQVSSSGAGESSREQYRGKVERPRPAFGRGRDKLAEVGASVDSTFRFHSRETTVEFRGGYRKSPYSHGNDNFPKVPERSVAELSWRNDATQPVKKALPERTPSEGTAQDNITQTFVSSLSSRGGVNAAERDRSLFASQDDKFDAFAVIKEDRTAESSGGLARQKYNAVSYDSGVEREGQRDFGFESSSDNQKARPRKSEDRVEEKSARVIRTERRIETTTVSYISKSQEAVKESYQSEEYSGEKDKGNSGGSGEGESEEDMDLWRARRVTTDSPDYDESIESKIDEGRGCENNDLKLFKFWNWPRSLMYKFRTLL